MSSEKRITSMTGNGLPKAKVFYQKAVEEFKRAKAEQDDVLFRDAAEKGWNATLLATNYLIRKLTAQDVKSNKQRREFLRELKHRKGKLQKYKFYERFGARAYYLHINAFYEGIYTEKELEENLHSVADYLRDVEKAVK